MINEIDGKQPGSPSRERKCMSKFPPQFLSYKRYDKGIKHGHSVVNAKNNPYPVARILICYRLMIVNRQMINMLSTAGVVNTHMPNNAIHVKNWTTANCLMVLGMCTKSVKISPNFIVVFSPSTSRFSKSDNSSGEYSWS